jgi:thymidylate kinase
MKLVAIVGADASGKDTQIAKLKAHLEALGKRVQVISIWDSLAEFVSISDKKILKQTVETFLLNFEAEARSFFLLSCLRNSESKIKTDCDYIFLNGFFHKYWASEISYGVDSTLWENNTPFFRKTDSVIYLRTSVEICLKRKEEWSNYEQGKGKFKGEALSSKEDFQKKLHSQLDLLMKQYPEVKAINGDQHPENVFNEILALI